MKTSIYNTMALLCLLPSIGYSQAAGNYYYNQGKSKGAVAYDAAEMNGNYNNRNAYQQSYSYVAPAASDTSFTLDASVMMNVKADEFVIIFGTSQVGETLEGCHELMNKRISDFTAAIAALGVKKEDVYIDYISQFPIYEVEVEKKLFSKSYNEIPKGFEVKKNIHVRYKSNTSVEQLLLMATKSELYDIVKVDYVIDNQAIVYDSLRSSCINIINRKVRDLKKLGVKFESMYQTINEDISSSYPLERYSTYGEFARFTGDQYKVGGKVLSRYDVPALYYNKLPYNSYDLVINPAVVEPVVQYTCKVQIKYVLKKQ